MAWALRGSRRDVRPEDFLTKDREGFFMKILPDKGRLNVHCYSKPLCVSITVADYGEKKYYFKTSVNFLEQKLVLTLCIKGYQRDYRYFLVSYTVYRYRG